MRTIAVVNQKGGSGKTTTAVNIAAALAECGERVLLVDLDAQASASAWLGTRQLDDRLLDVFLADTTLDGLATATDWPGLSLVPACTNLRDLTVADAVDVHHALRRASPTPGRFDHVLLDCPPALGHVVIAALAAADRALVPVAAHRWSSMGWPRRIAPSPLSNGGSTPNSRCACSPAGWTTARAWPGRSSPRCASASARSCWPRSSERTSESLRRPATGFPVLAYAPNSAGAQDHRAAAAELIGVSVGV